MGPVCEFCNQRCYTPLPEDTPEEVFDAMRAKLGKVVDLVATCPRGQAEELELYGWNWAAIARALSEIHELERLLVKPTVPATLYDLVSEILDPYGFKKRGGEL